MRNTFVSVVACVFLALVILRIEQGRTLHTTTELDRLPVISDTAALPEPTAVTTLLPKEVYTKRRQVRPSPATQSPPIADNPYLALYASEQKPRNRAKATAEYLSQVVYLENSEPRPRVSNREEQTTNPYLALEVAPTTEEQRVASTQHYLQTVSALP